MTWWFCIPSHPGLVGTGKLHNCSIDRSFGSMTVMATAKAIDDMKIHHASSYLWDIRPSHLVHMQSNRKNGFKSTPSKRCPIDQPNNKTWLSISHNAFESICIYNKRVRVVKTSGVLYTFNGGNARFSLISDSSPVHNRASGRGPSNT